MIDGMRESWERDQALQRDIAVAVADIDAILNRKPGLRVRTQIALELALAELRDERTRLQGAWD